MEDKDLIQQLVDKANSYQEDLLAMEQIDTKKAEETVLKTIRRRVRRERLHNTFYRVAAILVLPLLLSTVTLLYHYTQIKDRQMTVSLIETKSFPGAVSKIVLPDNSIVWLNNNSSLVYPSSFGNEDREVSLKGEGFFEVKSDQSHPFFVRLDNGLRVMAHGTRFNISSYKKDNVIEITLEKGAVDIFENDRTIAKLKPGEQCAYDKTTSIYKCRRVDAYVCQAWKDRKLIFRDTTLEEVLDNLSRKFDVEIRIDNKRKVTHRIRAAFFNEDIYQILRDIQLIAPITWHTETEKDYHRQIIYVTIK